MNYTCSLICDGKKAIMKRKIIALLLTLTMLVSMAPAVFAADAEFTDVPKDAWYSQAVAWAVENGITGGIGNGLFGPDNTCTRAQVVTFLWAAADKPILAAENPFEDVKSEDWYYNAVMWAVENGITGGTSATTFSPEAPCTRAQVVTFLYAASGKPEIVSDGSGFGDVTKNDWFYAPVMWAVANSITGGIGNGLFGPNNSCTRAQIALFLYKEDLIEPEAPPAKDVTVSMIAAEYGDRTAEWWKSFEADFEAENKHIDLVVDVDSWNNIYDDVNNRLTNNNAPNLLNIDDFAGYQADGLLLPAKEWISPKTYAKFYPAFLNESAADGKVWAVPDLASARALYFNADILAAAGVEAPTTWAELLEVCEAIKAYDDSIIPFGIHMTEDEGQATFAYYAWTNGGGFIDAEGNWSLNSAENAEAVDFAVALVKDGLTNADPANETRYDLQAMFAEGKLAMMIAPDQLTPMAEDINPDMPFGIAPIPVNKDGANATIGVMDRIMCFDNDYSEAELAAVKAVMDFFYEDTRYAEWCKMEGFLPATTGGAKAMMEIDDTAMDWDEILASARFYPAYKPEWWDVKQGVANVLQQTLQGGDAQKLLDTLQRQITGEPEPEEPVVETKVLNVAFNQSIHNPEAQTLQWISDELYRRTDGRYKLEIYPDAQLGDQAQTLEQVTMGELDMTLVSNSVIETYASDFAILGTPYVYDNEAHLNQVLQSDGLNELFASTEQYGFTVLSGYSLAARNVYTRDCPVKTPADLKNMKIRVMGSETFIKMINAMGGVPFAMAQGDVYSAIQVGVLDGAENNIITYMDLVQYEVAPYYNKTNHVIIPDFLVIGNSALVDMSPRDAEILKSVCKESIQIGYDKAAALRADYEKSALEKGVVIVEADVPAFQTLCADLIYSVANRSYLTRSAFDAIRSFGAVEIPEPKPVG